MAMHTTDITDMDQRQCDCASVWFYLHFQNEADEMEEMRPDGMDEMAKCSRLEMPAEFMWKGEIYKM